MIKIKVIALLILVVPLNEFDEILEVQVRQAEKLDQNVYQQLKGKFYEVVTSQNGSRVLQKVLKNTDQTLISSIFEELRGNFCNLMVNPYGNYFCQKFFGELPNHQRKEFLNEVIFVLKF